MDVVLATVMANRLEAITREIGAAMLRSARSPIFAQNRDFVTAIFDERLRMIAQTAYIPVLLGSTPFALQAIHAHFKDDIHPGDVMILNDPFQGNNHIPDITVVRPVFHRGQLRFWTLARGHHADLGGGGTAGYNPDATTAWEEGLRIPPSKLFRAGTHNAELWNMILTNVRLPSLVEGDLRCQVGATMIGERALIELLERYGPDVVGAAIDVTLASSETQMRARIRAMPDGVYTARRRLDDVGRGDLRLPTVKATVRIAGDSITIDFEGTSPQIPAYYNSTYANTVASCYIALFTTMGPEITLNEGSMRPISVTAPPGSLANAANGAATTMCTVATCAVIVETVWLALAQAVPDDTQAHWARTVAAMSSGWNPRTGRPFAMIQSFSKGGSGACRGFDGWNHISPVGSMGGSRSPDPELFELRSPHTIIACELRPDSAGPGTWRGGYGAHYRVRFLADTVSIMVSPACSSDETVPEGICGGLGPPPTRVHLTSANGDVVQLNTATVVRPRRGDVLDIYSTGGGGYGDPRARAAEAVSADVRSGLLSPAHARAAYGVAIDARTGTVDLEATAALRAGTAAEETAV